MTTSALRNRAAEANGQASTEVATTDTPPSRSIGDLIMKLRPEIERALPAHLDADRMARIALTTIRKTPKLAACTAESFAGSLLTAASLGLDVGNGEAYLVPYEHHKGAMRGQIECQLIIGYQGIAKLFWQSPLAKHLDAQTVYEKDEFSYSYGLAQHLRHIPARGNRGDVVCYYAVAELTTGGSAFVVLSPEDVKALRKGKVGSSGDIPDPMRWMERKTALRQLLKTLPKSATLIRAIDADERLGSDLRAEIIDTQPAQQLTSSPQSVPADAPRAEWDGEEPPMQPSQRSRIFGNFAKMGVTDDQLQRQYMTDVLGRPVTEGEHGRSSLTLVEADQVLDAQDMDLRDPGAES